MSSEPIEPQVQDWREYEALGFPVKEIFLRWVGSADLGERSLEDYMEYWASVWIEHHPSGPHRPTELPPATEATWSRQSPYSPSGKVMLPGVKICGHVSKADAMEEVHRCVLQSGHDKNGIPHEDGEYRWFSLGDGKPFKKTL